MEVSVLQHVGYIFKSVRCACEVDVTVKTEAENIV